MNGLSVTLEWPCETSTTYKSWNKVTNWCTMLQLKFKATNYGQNIHRELTLVIIPRCYLVMWTNEFFSQNKTIVAILYLIGLFTNYVPIFNVYLEIMLNESLCE